MRAAPTLALLLAACGTSPRQPEADSPGRRLEAAAVDAGLVSDPARVSLIGSWARDTDRVCVVPGGNGALRIGVLIDYGAAQGCAASGTARRSGAKVAIDFGACRFDARIDGDRLVFPADLPGACDAVCTGRASLAALAVDHLSGSTAEAETLRAPRGQPLCPTR